MKAKKGFTLIELTVALAIILAVTGGVLMRFRQNEHRVLNNASRTLQADLRYVQRRAMIEGRRYGVVLERYRYRVVSLTGGTRTIRIVNFPDGVWLRSTTHTQLEYLPRGTITSGSTIWLTTGTYSQRLTSIPSSGRIRIYDIINT